MNMEPLLSCGAVRAELRTKYQSLWDNANGRLVDQLNILLDLLVDPIRADQILSQLESHSPSIRRQIVEDLLRCADYALQGMYNSSSDVNRLDETGLFGRLCIWAEGSLRIWTIPPSLVLKQTSQEEQARARDTGASGDHFSGSICPFTNMPHAQLAHIIPVDIAGAQAKGRWFWLWIMLIIPIDTVLEIWSACGGLNNYAASNLIVMCQPLHRYFDSLAICFKLDGKSEQPLEYRFRIESPFKLSLHECGESNGAKVAIGDLIVYQPKRVTSMVDLPDLLLLQVHRYFVLMRGRRYDLTAPDPPPSAPSPAAPGDTFFNQRWDIVAGRPRSRKSTPSGSPAAPAPAGRQRPGGGSSYGTGFFPLRGQHLDGATSACGSPGSERECEEHESEYNDDDVVPFEL